MNCRDGFWACRNQSRCIPDAQVCDGVAHCLNNTDEENCKNWKCAHGMKKCDDNKQCIKAYLLSDSVRDCLDGSDLGCLGFRCEDGNCISKIQHCDGQFDCQDSSDEHGCPCESDSSLTTCPGSSECIPKSWVCDGLVNCKSELDENNCTRISSQPSAGTNADELN